MLILRSCGCLTRFMLLIHMFITCLSSNFARTEGFDSLIQLPQSGFARTPPRSRRVLHVGDFGAKGDGFGDDTEAFKNIWEIACSFPVRTIIEIPAGQTYLVRPIDFAGPCRSKLILRISGSVVAPKDPNVWDGLNPRKWLYFHGVNHLTLEGEGTINGMGHEWWARSCKTNKTNPCRHAPTAITFHRCKYLKVTNLMLVNSQQMHMAFTNCRRVVASYILVFAPAASPNTDGIHISASTGVAIMDSIIRTGDDCISIVGNSSRIKIRNIACGPGHGISIGSLGKSNSSVQVHDVLVDTAFLSNTENGLRIKTWQTLAVKVENISFVCIKGTSATEEAIIFACSDNSPCKGLYLEDIKLTSFGGGITRSFCWKAYGSSVGEIYPSSCFSCSESYIKQNVLPNFGINSF